ncbi:MAG: winged helix-turn-helix transcriptional regulator [Candidatus Aenigmarchaeota archaeon]|nr:winged helix-turn-helix transcriptional regulator [Candidatus Aenigmarchaeota archaeon]
MIKVLMKGSFYMSSLAKELNVPTPVVFKHLRKLELAGIIEREKMGNVHILRIKEGAVKKLKLAFDILEEPLLIEVGKNTTLLDALKRVPGIKVWKNKDGQTETTVDGKSGDYVYEINGKMPNEPIDKFVIARDVEIELKRLVPVFGKKIVIKMR